MTETDVVTIALLGAALVLVVGTLMRLSRYRRCPRCGARALTTCPCPACGDDPFVARD